MICETTAPPRPADELAGLLTPLADYLFDVADHYRAVGRRDEASAIIRVGLDLAVRALFLRSIGHLQHSLVPRKCIEKLRAKQRIDRQTHKALAALWNRKPETLQAKHLDRLARRFRVSTRAELDFPGPPRPEDIAKIIYHGVTQPHPAARSVLTGKRANQEEPQP